MADEDIQGRRRRLKADPGDMEARAMLQRRQARYATGMVWVLEQTHAVELEAPAYSTAPPPPPPPAPMSASQWEALVRLGEDRGWQGVPPWQQAHPSESGSGPAWDDPLPRVEQLRGHHARAGTLVLCFEDGRVYRRLDRGAEHLWSPHQTSRVQVPSASRRRVVRAASEEEARALAGRWPDGLLYLSWIEPARSTCSLLDLEGAPEVLA